MPPFDSGLCVVCGISTTQRCSSCAEHGFDLFLCGREHQKLIWFAHKKVCGKNSKPYHFPPLEPDEVSEATSKMNSPTRQGNTISEILCSFTGIEKTEVPGFIKLLGNNEVFGLERRELSAIRAWVRSLLYQQEDELPSGSSFQATQAGQEVPPGLYESRRLAAHVACVVALGGGETTGKKVSISFDEICETFEDARRLYTPFFHLVMVFTAVFQRIWHNLGGHVPEKWPAFDDPLCASLRQIRQQIQRLILHTASVDVKVANCMRQGLVKLPSFMVEW